MACSYNRLPPYVLKHMFNKKSDGRSEARKIYHQSMHDFWLKNSIISNGPANSSKRMTKEEFMENYKNIEDKELIKEEKVHKKTDNILMVVASKSTTLPVDSVSLSAF